MFALLFALAFGLTGLTLGKAAMAEGELVSCRYLKDQGDEIVLQLEIGTPAPATLIVIQNLPPGTTIVSTSPKVSKYDPKRGEAKWLLRKVRPGSMTIGMSLGQPLASGRVGGEIRYMDQASGSMITMQIEP